MNTKLLDETPVFVLPSLAVRLGLNEAIVIQQLHWALRRDTAIERDGARWFKAGLEFWCEMFPWWSETTIRRTFQNLRERQLVVSKRAAGGAEHAIRYSELASILDGTTADVDGASVQDGRTLVERGLREEREGGGAGAPGADMTLPGLDPPPEKPKSTAKADRVPIELVQRVWDHWMEIFGTHHRIKGLTDARIKMLRKALLAVDAENDAETAVNICHAATDGLQSYRVTHPGKIEPSVVFETSMYSQSNLTEQIEFWASQAETTLPQRDATAGGSHVIPLDLSGVPSVTKGRIQSERRHVVKMIARPDAASDIRERGQRAIDWLRDTVGHVPVIEDGAMRGWRQVGDDA